MASFDEHRFRRQVDTALVTVRRILERSRNPVYAENVQHTYHDKFTITECLVKAALACNLQTLFAMGLSADMIRTLAEWSKMRTITLRFRFEESCVFDREVREEVDSAEMKVTACHLGALQSMFRSKTVTSITEYFWQFEGKYELIAFRGVEGDENDQMLVVRRTFQHELKTRVNKNPRYERKLHNPIDVDITWLVASVSTEDLRVTFSIDREDAGCRTPRRNAQVEQATHSFNVLRAWCTQISQHFQGHVFSMCSGHKLNLSAIHTHGIFVPVLPILENNKSSLSLNQKLVGECVEDNDGSAVADNPPKPTKDAAAPAGATIISATEQEGSAFAAVDKEGSAVAAADTEVDRSVTLKPADMAAFLAEEQRTLALRLSEVSKELPPSESGRAISAAEGKLLVCLGHLVDVADHLVDGVGYVEAMLRRQLTAAVGKVVGPADFAAYMRFHCRRLLLPGFEPRPFCYAVRRSPRHSPEGYLSMEESFTSNGPAIEPIYTVVQSGGGGAAASGGGGTAAGAAVAGGASPRMMEFALNAAAKVRFAGERHVHAWVRHSFAAQEEPRVFLSAQSRQFCSFIVLIGTVPSPRVFEPRYGMIVQNKEDVRIPLVLETIPSPNDFADAIESLSPEQQAFATAFRGMQLSTAVFAVCVIQIKPQLERLLNLPHDSLTKEIKLTHDISELFTKYQIPSDLLSCGTVGADDIHAAGAGAASATPLSSAVAAGVVAGSAAAAAEKVEEVKRHVEAIRELIDAFKKRELEEKREESLMSALDRFDSETVGALAMSASVGYVNNLNFSPAAQQRFRQYRPPPFFSSAKPRLGTAPPAQGASHSGREAPGNLKRLAGVSIDPPAARFRPSPGASTAAAEGGIAAAAQKPADVTAASQAPRDQASCDQASRDQQPRPDGAGDDDMRGAEADVTDDSDLCPGAAGEDSDIDDYSRLPVLLDRRLEAQDSDSALRATTIRPAESWTKRSAASLLLASQSRPEPIVTLRAEGQRAERRRAFELLDALTRGGALPLEDVTFHVVLAATHGFAQGVVDTVIEAGVNPIDKAERSMVVMVSAVAGREPVELVRGEQLPRLCSLHPALFQAAAESGPGTVL